MCTVQLRLESIRFLRPMGSLTNLMERAFVFCYWFRFFFLSAGYVVAKLRAEFNISTGLETMNNWTSATFSYYFLYIQIGVGHKSDGLLLVFILRVNELVFRLSMYCIMLVWSLLVFKVHWLTLKMLGWVSYWFTVTIQV